jgi:flagellar protein FliS
MVGNQFRAAAAYKEVHVNSRSPLELVVMLYDGALGALAQTRDAVGAQDLHAKRDALSKVMAIIAELQGTLNMEAGGEVAYQLDAIYTYVLGRLVDGNVNGDSSAFDEVVRLLTPLRDAWAEIAAAPQAIAG